MPQNPLYIQPASGLSGFKALQEGIGKRVEYERKKAEEAQKMKKRQEAGEAINRGDPEEVSKFMIENPDIAEEIRKTMVHVDEITEQNYKESLERIIVGDELPSQVGVERSELVDSRGGDATESMQYTAEAQEEQAVTGQQEQARKKAELYYSMHFPEEWETLNKARGIEKQTKEYAPTELGKLIDERQRLIDEGTPENNQLIKAYDKRIAGAEKREYQPSPLQKLINEREEYIQQGLTEDDPIIRAYDSKISGTDIDIKDMTNEEVDTWGQIVNLTGKMPSLGRGKQSTKVRMAIAKSAARQALGANRDEVPEDDRRTPSEAALNVIGTQADTKAIGGAINFLTKQLSSMGSFVSNIEMQIDKVSELSKDLKTFDARLMNIPLRTLRGRVAGSPLQSKYDMYLAEIESEIGKLATGSTASVAELSATAQERWAKIHDKNLSVNDMLSLLDETKHAARMRYRSVENELDKTRKKMRDRNINPSGFGIRPEEVVEETQGWSIKRVE